MAKPPIDNRAQERRLVKNSMLQSIVQENSETLQRGSHEIVKIPLTKLKFRDENNFIISGIEKLAKSIESTMQAQPCIVYRNPDKDDEKAFCISAGERRTRAIALLYEKYKALGDVEKMKKYSTVECIVLNSKEEAMEQDLYRDTNTESRQLTPLELIINMHSEYASIKEGDEAVTEIYKALYGEEETTKIFSKKATLPWNPKVKTDYILYAMKKEYGQADYSPETIRGYIKLIDYSTNEMLKAIFSGKVSIRLARQAVSESDEVQTKIVELCEEGKTDEAAKYLESVKKEKQTEEEANEFDLFKEFKSLTKEFEKISTKVNDIPTSIVKNENGNTKEYLKQLRTISKAISKLKTMPIK